MSPVSVARLTARQEHTLSRILRFPPLSARPLSNSANYFPRFPGRRPPHTSPVGGGCVKSSISFGSFCGGKVHFFYKKHPPFHFLTKNTPPFHLLSTGLYSRQRSGSQSSTIRRLPLAAFLLLGAACQLARLRFLLARSRCSGAGTG